ncbi:MAG: DHA2 family efflux MFS transporter permease subunit [Capsulimonadaceae bacterium]|nr:DHA2 family efflux MFS transporter permease subunit [Capsulimonadaceae bacterium]
MTTVATVSRPVSTATPVHDEEHPNKYVVSMAVIFGVLMSAIDTSVVNVALPQIQGNVGATQQEVTWISTGYMISVVILMPLTNWLSVRFGRKNVYLTSLAVFVFSSLMCGMSHTLSELIFWRVIQGFGAGTLQPLAQAIFREAFPPEEQGVAMGIFGFVVLFGPAIGPTLGGYITDNYSWPWIFFINLPIGVIGFLVAARYLYDPPYMKGGQRRKVDAVGIGLLAIGLASMQTVLEQGQTEDWFNSNAIIAGTVVSIVTLIAFLWWEMRIDDPAVDLRVLKDPTFFSGTIIGGILGLGLFASLFLLPQYMQTLLGFTATQSGLSLMPRSLVMMLAMPVAGALYNRLGPKVMIGAGLLLTIYSQYQMAQFTLETGAQDILWPQILQGIGFGFVFVALSTVALANIAPARMTSATGLNNLIRQLGGSFGTTIVVTILTRQNDVARSSLVPDLQASNPAFLVRLRGIQGLFVHNGYGVQAAHDAALRLLNLLLVRQTFMLAYEYVFICIGVLFTICLPLIFVLHQPKHAPIPSQHAAVEA